MNDIELELPSRHWGSDSHSAPLPGMEAFKGPHYPMPRLSGRGMLGKCLSLRTKVLGIPGCPEH